MGPPVWINLATLSTVDSFPSQDPENSGFGPTQVTVWEEWNGADWDIYMSFSLLDGALGSWSAPVPVAVIPNVDERNPAVAVTRDHGWGQEIHVVYERWNAAGFWEVCHKYTANWGRAWLPLAGPNILNTMANVNAIDPACVYTEDLAPTVPPGIIGFIVQIVWAEETGAGLGDYQIQYDAWYYDPTRAPPRNLLGPTILRTNPNGAGFDCMKPEIASVDERTNALAYDYTFSVVWQEEWPSGIPIPLTQWHVWYLDGISWTSPLPSGTIPGAPGQINIAGNQADALEPDIAATQDYQALEWFYFHIVFQYKTWPGALWPFQPNSIESAWSCGAVPLPGPAAFVLTTPVTGPFNITLETPTVASKLISLNPTVFESWFAWEDWSIVAMAPDIWYRVGTMTTVPLAFAWTVAPGLVPLVPFGTVSNEYNPELWNRNDVTRMFPPFTHLVCDSDVIAPPTPEILYIDP
jgi:hypothetical protein